LMSSPAIPGNNATTSESRIAGQPPLLWRNRKRRPARSLWIIITADEWVYRGVWDI
jgi:hypothetical protein